MEKAKVEQKFEKKGGLDNNLVLLIASAVVDLTQESKICQVVTAKICYFHTS